MYDSIQHFSLVIRHHQEYKYKSIKFLMMA